MSNIMLRPCIVKVSILDYFPLYLYSITILNLNNLTSNTNIYFNILFLI